MNFRAACMDGVLGFPDEYFFLVHEREKEFWWALSFFWWSGWYLIKFVVSHIDVVFHCEHAFLSMSQRSEGRRITSLRNWVHLSVCKRSPCLLNQSAVPQFRLCVRSIFTGQISFELELRLHQKRKGERRS